MKLEAKSPIATLGKFMVDFNEVFPTLFLRFYKSDEFSIENRLPYTTKLKDLTTLPLSISFAPNDTINQVIEKLKKGLSVKYIEVVYYPKDASGAYRLSESNKSLTIEDIKARSAKEGWLTEKEKKKFNLG